MRMIFVNLPVKDVVRSKAFFGGLGFTFNPEYSSDDTLCMIIEENIFCMLMNEARFKEFIIRDIADTTKVTEVLTALSASSRAEVDDTLAKALALGGKEWRPIMDYGFMYGCSFQDPDGHVWELAYMEPQQAD
ncbi:MULTISPECIES: VOC family protein [unclassified Rhizobium]|uniref:VOC family protein n=1 Tax=unclassified Rhizobium TaxID=2613769 RepID=UPI000715F874|nr:MULTISPECIES: VOC family protein [unclassified Rhizobium]KQS89679.1 glyoxalase [Rhizobium sp. Leaf391]KQS94959.1 glyoxalase [Rhizobium sp. Leaf386]KQU01335.1 glyoxalase [Rhizobium sp. Leaf453]